MLICTVFTCIVIFLYFCFYTKTTQKDGGVKWIEGYDYEKREIAEVGGISSLKNDSWYTLQEGQTIWKLKSTLIFEQGTNLHKTSPRESDWREAYLRKSDLRKAYLRKFGLISWIEGSMVIRVLYLMSLFCVIWVFCEDKTTVFNLCWKTITFFL